MNCRFAGAVAALCLTTGLFGPGAARAAENQKVILGLPATVMANVAYYVAESLGYWKSAGLDVEMPVLVGPAAADAVIANDAQFAANNAATTLVIAIHHQPLIQVASTTKTFNNEIVLSKAAAAKTGLDPAKASFEQRARALKGLTLGSGQSGTNLDLFLRHVAALAGLDPERDITRVALDSPALVGAMEAGRIDGFSGVLPYPQIAEVHGSGVIWIDNARGDVPDLKLAASAGLSARPDYCAKNADICKRVIAGIQRGADFVAQQPAKALELVTPYFKGQDPKVLEASFELARALQTPGGRYTEDMWRTTQKFDLDAGLIKPNEQLGKFEGVAYTNAYLP